MAAGHACILSSGYYLDLFYPADLHHAYAPDAAEEELLAQENALLDDPRLRHVAAGLKWTQGWRESAQHQSASGGAVLGGEACLWSELVSEELLPVRLWSRMPALADRFWSNREAPQDLAACLEAALDRLAKAGIVDVQGRSRELLRALGVSERQLPAVELLEPVKWYARLLGEAALAARIQGTAMPQARPYRVDTPLDRPIDALLPESFAAARFKSLLAQGGTPLIAECERLLAICEEPGFAPELTAPIQSLALVLKTVLDQAQGRIDIDAARRRVVRGGEPKANIWSPSRPWSKNGWGADEADGSLAAGLGRPCRRLSPRRRAHQRHIPSPHPAYGFPCRRRCRTIQRRHWTAGIAAHQSNGFPRPPASNEKRRRGVRPSQPQAARLDAGPDAHRRRAAVGEFEGEVWRLWSYIDGRSLSRLESDAQAEAAGRAFGRTRRWLQDIDGVDRREVIPGFLQLRHYLAAYAAGPRAEPQLAAFIDARRSLAERFRRPNGYIHGDCKIDNLVFDDGDKVVAVLDLDTLMWGHWAWSSAT